MTIAGTQHEWYSQAQWPWVSDHTKNNLNFDSVNFQLLIIVSLQVTVIRHNRFYKTVSKMIIILLYLKFNIILKSGAL